MSSDSPAASAASSTQRRRAGAPGGRYCPTDLASQGPVPPLEGSRGEAVLAIRLGTVNDSRLITSKSSQRSRAERRLFSQADETESPALCIQTTRDAPDTKAGLGKIPRVHPGCLFTKPHSVGQSHGRDLASPCPGPLDRLLRQVTERWWDREGAPRVSSSQGRSARGSSSSEVP